MASTNPANTAASVDWEGVFYHWGLATSAAMEASAELEHLSTLYPALARDPRFAAELRTAQRLRDSLQAVALSIAYPLAEQSRTSRELAWQQALGGSRC